MIRFFIVLGLLLFVVLLPPLATALLACVAALFFPRFWETVLVGLFLDALYGVAEPRWFGFQFIYTLALCVVVYAIEQLKKSVRLYRVPL